MPLNVNEVGSRRTRWIALEGHLVGVDLLVRGATPQEARRFSNKLQQMGITRPNRDNPLDVVPGREEAFFLEIARQYVLDWRGDVWSDDERTVPAPFDVVKMGQVLGAYQRAFQAVQVAVAEEDAFFVTPPSPPTSS